MKITYFQITEDTSLKEISVETFTEPWKQGKGLYWINIQECLPEELEEWLRSLNISDLAIELCVNQNKVTAVLPLDDEVYFEFPACLPQSSTEVKDHYTTILCLKNLMIVIVTSYIPDYDRFVQILKTQLKLAKKSISSLLSAFLAREAFRSSQMVDGLRASAFQLDERMDRDPDSVEAEEILDQKRRLRAYDTIVNGQAGCLEQLRALDVPFLTFTQNSTFFNLAIANTLAASNTVTRLDNMITDLSQRYGTNQQEKTNRRLAILTCLTAIFMPLTLIAGIYGMNFEYMPELKISWAYPVVITSMLLLAVGMYRYFKIRGWLE